MSGARSRRLGAALAAALGLAGMAGGQETGPGTIADVPSGPATIRGRVIHEAQPEAVSGVEVALYALSQDGAPGTRQTTTDANGAFVFADVSNDPGVVYLVGARHAGVPFPGGRVTFAGGDTEREVEIRISEPTEDASQVRVVLSSVRVFWSGDRLGVSESHRLRNEGDRVFHVPPARRVGRRPALQAELLPGADAFTMPLGLVPEGAVLQGEQFRFWGPIYPGEQEITFRYEVPVAPGAQRLAKRFPSPTGIVRVAGREDGPLEAVEGLTEGAPLEEEGVALRSFGTENTEAGFVATLELRVPDTASEPGAVTLAESQLVMEIDDVQLRVQEQHRIEVASGPVQRAPEGEVLIEIPLPEGAENLRLSADATALGLVQTDRGVGLQGPLRPGSHGIGIAYELPSGPDGVRFERRFDRRLPLLRTFVADTGVVVETDRLHRRRPVRDADRVYLVYEAFELMPEEPIAFALRALPPRVGSRRPALLLAVVAGLASVALLLAPLRRTTEGPALPEADGEPGTREEREHLYASIRDVDHDYETGKLDEADWQALRAELRGRAVILLAQERGEATARAQASAAPEAPSNEAPAAPGAAPSNEAPAAPGAAPSNEAPAAPETAGACPACDAATRPTDRFCSHCGTPLQAQASS